VLAKPCGVTVRDANDAQGLFNEMQRAVWLVTFEDGALRHRSDVRRSMIHLLREEEPDKVRDIEEAAVAYYAQQEGVTARAEEIYHRLSLKQLATVLNQRWLDGVQRYLFSALEELSARERAWLASRLGVPLSPQERELADLEGWERDTEQRVRELLQRGEGGAAIEVLNARPQRTPGSPLYVLAAQAWEQQGEWQVARQVVQDGLTAAHRSANRTLVIALLLRGARLDSRMGEFAAARRRLDEAAALLPDRGDATLHLLEINLYRLGIDRIEHNDPTRHALQAELRACFTQLSDAQATAQPLLMS